MFFPHKPFRPSLMLLGKAVAYLIVEQLKCTFIWVGSWPFLQTLVHQHSFLTYEITKKARVLHYTRLERLAKDDNSNLLDPF